MQFLYEIKAGEDILEFGVEQAQHLRARRVRDGERIAVRNLRDGYEYLYDIELQRRGPIGRLAAKSRPVITKSGFLLAWAVVDSAAIERALPMLNELGVEELALVWADFSQRDIRLNIARFTKILIASCEQCGRGDLMKISMFASSDELLNAYGEPNVVLIDFAMYNLDEFLSGSNNDEFFIPFVGPEGGFSERERTIFTQKLGLKSKNILRSQTAAVSVAAKFLA